MSNTFITILGFMIIFIATSLGSAMVFCFKNEISPKVNTLLLGFAAGVMIAASVFGLLIPSINQASETMGSFGFVPAVISFLIGGLFLVLLDYVVPHKHSGTGIEEGPNASISKPTKLFLAITIHNIPEGLAVGFAFGAASLIGTTAAYLSALSLAIGIAIQNFPEGATISLPMKNATGSKTKSFLYGVGSGAVEPIAAVIGFFIASALTVAQPWFLGFAAGAMIFVVAEDLIPDAKLASHPHYGTWGVMFGFAIMMILDVVFS